MARDRGGSSYAARRARRAAFASHRSYVSGAKSFRRLLRGLPDAVRHEIVVELHVAGREILPAMRGRTPWGRGTLRAGLSYRVSPATLRLRVGLIGRPINRRLFYGRILDLGRKAQIAAAKRRTPSGGLSSYVMNVGAIRPIRFVTGSYSILRGRLGRNLRRIWDRALRRVAGGGGL